MLIYNCQAKRALRQKWYLLMNYSAFIIDEKYLSVVYESSKLISKYLIYLMFILLRKQFISCLQKRCTLNGKLLEVRVNFFPSGWPKAF